MNEPPSTADVGRPTAPADVVDAVVVGAGLAGLAAGATLALGGRRVVVLDGRSPGGRARTTRRDGFSFNQGPHALYRGHEAERVLAGLGIVAHGHAPLTNHAACDLGGTRYRLPTGPRAIATTDLLGLRERAEAARLLGRLAKMDTAALAGCSAAEWVAGLELRPRVAALVTGLARVASYVGDLADCSADAVARQLQLAVTRGVRYLDGGFGSVVAALAGAATGAGAELLGGWRVDEVVPTTAGFEVHSAAGTVRARTVVLAVGDPAAAARICPPAAPGVAARGAAATAACLDVGMVGRPRVRFVVGLDRPLYLSVHSPPTDLAPDGSASVQVMRYGARSAEEDRAELWALAASVGVREDSVVTSRFLRQMVVTPALPLPGLGLAGRPTVQVAALPGCFLAGDFVGPLGMLADASLSSGEAAGHAARSHLERSGRRAGAA